MRLLREAQLVYQAPPSGPRAGQDTGSVPASTFLQCITETVDEVKTVQGELSNCWRQWSRTFIRIATYHIVYPC